MKKFPIVTIAILIVSWISYEYLTRRYAFGIYYMPTVLIALLNPIIHYDQNHLNVNTVDFLLLGSLWEIWPEYRWRLKYATYFSCYVASIIASVYYWLITPNGEPSRGLSVMVAAILGCLSYYYLSHFRKMQSVGQKALPLVIILFGFCYMFILTSNVNQYLFIMTVRGTPLELHAIGLFIGSFFGFLLMRNANR